jgi:DNA-binding GntR family transcriptional regulator
MAQVFKQQAYQELKRRLVNCEYRPGTWINETALVKELGFSRTPIREALALIEQEGFIRIIPKKGIFVTQISFNDVKQIFQTRKILEPVALRLACPRLPREKLLEFRELFVGQDPDIRAAFRQDTAMHLFIIEHCGNRYIIEMLCKVFEENTRIIISSKQNELMIHDARAEHTEILDLLLDGKFEQATAAMSSHIQHCERAAIEFFYNSSSYEEPRSMSHVSLDQIHT